MTKAEIVAKISEKLGIEKTEVQNVVEHFMEGIKDSLEKALRKRKISIKRK